MFRGIIISFCLFFFTINGFSQKKQTTEQYIKKYYKIAIREMKSFKIPASITLAQGILESASGNSALAKKAKNHFGIKCHKSWKGKKYYMDDDEKDECFRVYKNPEKSFVDHSLFLTNRGRYSFLFTDFATTDYKKWARGLKKAGYATNPNYPKLLINIIEKYHLYKYDRIDFIPEEKVQEDVLVLEEINDDDFVIEETDEYIKAIMGRNVYYSNKEKGIFIFNRIKTIKAKGKTPIEIAVEFDINHSRLLKYNEITANDIFKEPTQNVFLQPKRAKGSQKEYLVKPGDSMWEISQMFGLKISKLYKYNLMQLGEQAKPGEHLNLRKKKKEKVKTISYSDVLKAKRKIKEDKPKKIVQKTVIKPIETTININIINETENKKIEVETIETENKVNIKKNGIEEYPKEKYVDKNEEIEKLINQIPIKTESKIVGHEINSNTAVIVHIVKQGETLYFLSKKYNVQIEEIKRLNNLQDNSIDIGQELILSH